MTTTRFGFFVLVGVLLGSTAVAQEPNMPATGPASSTSSGEPGGAAFEIGVRVGYGVPLGTAFSVRDATTGILQDAKLSDEIKGMIPLSIDIGYRFDPNWYLGGFFQYGIGFIPNNSGCSNGISCSTSDLRFGLTVRYHFLPSQMFDPWFGIGAGYEILHESASGTLFGVPFDVSGSVSGFEFGHAQAGVDIALSSMFSIGPFAEFTIGQYSSSSGSASAGGQQASSSTSIDNKTLHEWLIFGLRAAAKFSFE